MAIIRLCKGYRIPSPSVQMEESSLLARSWLKPCNVHLGWTAYVACMKEPNASGLRYYDTLDSGMYSLHLQCFMNIEFRETR